MSTSCRDGSPRRRITWRRLTIVWITVGVLLASVSCTGRPADRVENPTVISYAGAASRLSGLEPAEVEEQLRDWTRTGLASHLELDTARLRDAFYDTVPVRDLAFADLSRQSTGPGRALFDGRDVLHVLVPRGDPHEARTIGLLLDQHRSDAGADPQQVQIHHYQISSGTQTIGLTHEKPAPTSEVRSAHGFVTMRVDETKGLTDFLAQTRHLSWLEVRGSEIWAGGWNWPDVPGAPLDFEDVSVLQRGYLQPASESRPGFSLDPGPPTTREDIAAVLPDLRPELADRLSTNNWKGSRFGSAERFATAVDTGLSDQLPPALLAELGLPSDRAQLWALSLLLAGKRAYSQARYEGQLEGTEVGMTLFYNDYMAKYWVHGVGTGVPTKAVGGFIPNSDAMIPWSHCSDAGPQPESGRLWFGQNESGFAFDNDRVSIGAQATRLFARSDGEGGTEIERSFAFGRGLRWWDQHYQAVADYEPQYQRLDQIMRWSGALDWLTSTTGVTLPQLDDAAIRSDLRFKDWYAQHSELRERSEIEFVTPPSATQEAILAKPSKVYENCGISWISGGVSLGDVIQRKGGRSYHADLPEPVRRAGLFNEASHLDPLTGVGRIEQLSIDGSGNVIGSLQRTFSMRADGRAVIDLVADGRREAPFGGLKVHRAETASRQLEVDVAADRGQVSQRVEFQDQELGELVARKAVDTVMIQWRPGWLDRARRGLESFQDRLRSQPAAELPAVTDGVLYSFQDASGRVAYKVGGPGDPWLSITNERTPPGEEMVLRLGGPHPKTGEAQFFEGRFSQRPELPPADGGPPSWMEITPPAGGHSAKATAGLLGPDARPVRVTTPDGASATAFQIGDRALARSDDSILGLDGTAEGAALLRDLPRVAEAMRDAAQANDGLRRGVLLGDDAVALVDADGVILAAAAHPIAGRVRQATGAGPSPPVLLFRIEGNSVQHVDPSALTRRPGAATRTTLGELWNTGRSEVYLRRSMLDFEHSPIIPNDVPFDTKVIVAEFTVADRPNAEATASTPDVRIHEGVEWWRMSGPGVPTGPGGTPTSTPTPAPGSGVVPGPSGQILLVCPDTNENLPGCEQ